MTLNNIMDSIREAYYQSSKDKVLVHVNDLALLVDEIDNLTAKNKALEHSIVIKTVECLHYTKKQHRELGSYLDSKG